MIAVLFLMIGAQPQVDDIEIELLKQRESLLTGQMTIEGNVTSEPRKFSLKFTKKIWFDRKKFRADTISPDGLRKILCEPCEAKDTYVLYDEEALQDDKKGAPVVLESIQADRKMPAQLQRFDPRILGLSTHAFGHFHAAKLSEILGRTNRVNPEWHAAVWKDKQARVLSFENKSGARFRTTFVPEFGNGVVVSEMNVDAMGRKAVKKVEAELVQHGAGKTWFPKRVISYYEEAGRVDRYDLRIKDVSFNEPISDTVFSLAGMDIPPGAKVLINTRNAEPGIHIWDGKRIIRQNRQLRVGLVPSANEGNARSEWLSILSLATGALGCTLVGYYCYSRKSSK